MAEKLKVQYDKVPTKALIDDNEKLQVPVQYGYGVRHVQMVIFFLCSCVLFMARGHLAVTIVAMTMDPEHINKIAMNNDTIGQTSEIDNGINSTDIIDHSVSNISVESVIIKNNTSYNIENISHTDYIAESKDSSNIWNINKKYNWPKPIQEMLLGAFFLGYCIMMFPVGLVCQRFGGKLPIQVALLVNSVVSILTPWLAAWGGWKAVCACRIAQGLSQSGLTPGLHTLIAKWAPINERGSLGSYAYVGTMLGTIMAFQISGVLAESRWGWPSSFWATGGICLVVFIIFTIFGKASPQEHKTISEEELNFIQGSVNDGKIKKRNLPWKAIATSKPLWALFSAHVGTGLAFVFYFTQVPSYIHYILGVDVQKSGLLSSLPYVVAFFTLIGFGIVSDYCTNKKWVSMITARRISNSLASVGLCVCMLLATFTNNLILAMTWLVCGLALHMGMFTGFMVNHIDLAPNFSGTLMAIGNTFMNMFILLIPVVVSHIVTDVRNLMQWRITISVVVAFATLTNAIFLLFGSSDTQPWNDYDGIDNDIPVDDIGEQKLKKNSLIL